MEEIIYLTEALCEYIKNSYKLTMKRYINQVKNGQRHCRPFSKADVQIVTK